MEPHDKLMSLTDAVRAFVHDDAVVGIGGQNILRCAVATAHEIIRQHRRRLTLVGCNLSIHADMLIGAGCVRRCECGTGNLERFGITFRFRQAVEDGTVDVEDYDHSSMLSRFLAAATGVPFLPITNIQGSGLRETNHPTGAAKFHEVANPWRPHERVLLVPALAPDVSIVHANKADRRGNLLILGPVSHDPELIRASRAVIATCEEMVPEGVINSGVAGTIVPHHFVSAVVEQRFGAYPTAVFGEYTFDSDHIRAYQTAARAGGAPFDDYLSRHVTACATFADSLTAAGVDNNRVAVLRAGAQ